MQIQNNPFHLSDNLLSLKPPAKMHLRIHQLLWFEIDFREEGMARLK